jgi:hypothetical protein
VRRYFQVTIAGGWLHVISDEDVLVTLDQVFFFQTQIGITIRLIHEYSFAINPLMNK